MRIIFYLYAFIVEILFTIRSVILSAHYLGCVAFEECKWIEDIDSDYINKRVEEFQEEDE